MSGETVGAAGRLNRFKPQARVRWLAPSVLARSVRPLLLSALFARFSDRREVEAVMGQGILDLSRQPGTLDPCISGDPCAPLGQGPERTELWIDYVADTGDGFDATATVASLLAPGTLALPALDGSAPHVTRAGDLLVLGGDQVYPFASLEEYRNRLLGPFRSMLPCADPGRTVVAIPGNHDWYDGLTAFLQVFCGRQWIGGWKTVQRRSYFAVKLPQRWWLWGIDIQLDTYIDQPQLEYFRQAATQVGAGDGIILCWAKPSWVKAGGGAPGAYDTLDYFQRHVVPDRAEVRLALTGDSHHYARYEGPDGEHKITAGLGGAYLTATHHLPPTLHLPPKDDGGDPVPFTRQNTYPTGAESRALRRRVLSTIHANNGFAAVPATAYGTLAAAVTGRRPRLGSAVAAAVVAGCVAFSEPRKSGQAWPGLAHAAAHLATAVGLIGALGRQTRGRSEPGRRATVVAGAAAAGAAVGPFVFALYLLAADRIGPRGTNTNELFAAQAIEGHKGFLRLHVQPDGGLTVYPVKVD